MIVNRNEIADIFGVAKTTIDSWVKKGCPVLEKSGTKGKPSKYNSANVYRWLLVSSSDEDFTQLLDEERHRKLKRENDIEENLIAPVSLLTEALEKGASQIVPILESLPLEMKRRNPALTGSDIHLVKKSIAKCRNAIADIEIDLND